MSIPFSEFKNIPSRYLLSGMKTIDEIRVENLLSLKNDCGGVSGLADKIGKSPVQLRHLLGGFKGIGNNIAREIEEKLGLERGWMDHDHSIALYPTKAIEHVAKSMMAMEPAQQYLTARVVDQIGKPEKPDETEDHQTTGTG